MKSIGTKLALQIALALIGIMLLFGVVNIYRQRQQDIRSFHAKEDRISQQLSLILGGLLYDMYFNHIEKILHSYLTDPDILAIKVLDHQQQSVAYLGTHPKTHEILDFAQTSLSFSENISVGEQDILYDDELMGELEIVFSLQAIDEGVRESILSMGLSLFLILIIESLVVVLLVRKNMVTPLLSLIQAGHRISEGELDIHLKDVTSRDEIGQVMVAMNVMIEKLKHVITKVKTASDRVASESQNLQLSSDLMTQGVNEQASASEKASASTEQILANIKQNSDNTLRTTQIAIKSAEDAQMGEQAVTEAVTAMQEIAKKVQSIHDIARQTRMLSLNATIEAARAEDQGQGFAVVASEVRSLAERSQKSAIEINELANFTVQLVEKGSFVFNQLVPAIQNTSELLQEINAAGHEQNAGAEEINKAILQLDNVIQQNASISKETALTANDLARQAEQLQEIIGFFKIEIKEESSQE